MTGNEQDVENTRRVRQWYYTQKWRVRAKLMKWKYAIRGPER